MWKKASELLVKVAAVLESEDFRYLITFPELVKFDAYEDADGQQIASLTEWHIVWREKAYKQDFFSTEQSLADYLLAYGVAVKADREQLGKLRAAEAAFEPEKMFAKDLTIPEVEDLLRALFDELADVLNDEPAKEVAEDKRDALLRGELDSEDLDLL